MESMTKIDFQVNDVESGGVGDGNGQTHRSEDVKLQKLGVKQQLKVCARDSWLWTRSKTIYVYCRGDSAYYP